MELIDIADTLARKLRSLRFDAPVTHVYNPLVYAREMHCAYLRRFGAGRKEVVLLGMNPGPWGMAQTGVPFGEVSAVQEWMKLEAPIGKPKSEHPKRPVLGLDCPRQEVSGKRLWGWAQDTFGTPARFSKRFFAANYCPLCFLEETGRNRTPDKLPAAQRERLFSICDEALRALVVQLKPRYVIGIGQFAEARAQVALAEMDLTIGRILHPSPASPAANRGWAEKAGEQLAACGVKLARQVVPTPG